MRVLHKASDVIVQGFLSRKEEFIFACGQEESLKNEIAGPVVVFFC